MSIQIQKVTKSFGSFTALNNINLDIPTGELVALLGPSGSGKTSLLRIIAGLEVANQGSILFGKEDITNSDPKERQVGFVFQHYALFKHLTVFENIAFGLKVRPRKTRPSKEQIKEKVNELLNLVKMEGLANRYPAQLSGGQRQRIALARALAVEPKVLLLDEPFGALDAKVRKDLRRWLRRLHDEFHITSVFVTHDQEEALDVADRVVIMNDGKIEQIGTPEEVYENPETPFVYNFLGNVNLFKGRIQDGIAKLGNIEIETPEFKDRNLSEAVGYYRPHNINIEHERTSTDAIPVIVNHIHMVGPIVNLELKKQNDNDFIEAEISKETFGQLNLKVGDLAYATPTNVKVFLPEDFAI
ncbi:sulfate/molybdate ABC transporter ATP-binding protein [Halalkalibacter alkalisediminis]|uniref:Sulfate/molybdate ABC transporter ATP-binding protein n=1 Tax=Halalkalibacter alkalisediminis TaxID=935616 RepID=A0ABV6NDM6_9BACI|nr:sulfate ABC transporter ATP-binding protein [Halalkalibacter alkalisediminis]